TARFDRRALAGPVQGRQTGSLPPLTGRGPLAARGGGIEPAGGAIAERIPGLVSANPRRDRDAACPPRPSALLANDRSASVEGQPRARARVRTGIGGRATAAGARSLQRGPLIRFRTIQECW